MEQLAQNRALEALVHEFVVTLESNGKQMSDYITLQIVLFCRPLGKLSKEDISLVAEIIRARVFNTSWQEIIIRQCLETCDTEHACQEFLTENPGVSPLVAKAIIESRVIELGTREVIEGGIMECIIRGLVRGSLQ